MTERQMKTLQKVSELLLEQDPRESAVLKDIQTLQRAPDQKNLCSELLKFFVHASFTEDEAQLHWDRIFANYDAFARQFNRNVGLRVAIFDYFVNHDKVIASPIMVEIYVLKETEKLAMLDSLTGIFNRRYFDISLNKEIKRALRYNKILSLLMIDLDNFKAINDSQGHLFGDKVLQQLATILNAISREEDIPCRYGGEEFVVILPETDVAGAINFAARLRAEMHGDAFFKDSGITYSGGITAYPEGGDSSSTLLESADKALYQAKFAGKDRCMVSENAPADMKQSQ